MANIAFTSMKSASYCNKACNYTHKNKYNDYRLQNNRPEENTCRNPYYKSTNRVPYKMIWLNEPVMTIKNKRE